MGDSAIELKAADGRIFAYACPRCLSVNASMSGGGRGEQGRATRAEWSKESAEQCCLCRSCGGLSDYGITCTACRKAEDERMAADPERQAWLNRCDAATATFERSPNPTAARLLARLMSYISEECWCAGWMSGTEFSLWKAVQTGDRKWGMGEVSSDEIAQLQLLIAQAGGWVIYGDGGEEFVSLEEWHKRIDVAHTATE